MEYQVKKRKSIRASFTKTFNSLIQELSLQEPNGETVSTKFKTLERLSADLNMIDDEILHVEDKSEKEFEEEWTVIEEYKEKMDIVRVKVETFQNKLIGVSNSVPSVCSSPNTSRRKLKLPKIELKKFKSEVKDWLSFWSQFVRIHDDTEIEPEDKFQYLIQVTEEGTRAREIVNSYPPTADNYEKVIQSLKSRFGKDELLIEFYVRELLGLVITNATSTMKNKLSASQLYDRLESYLRALESIGMTYDKYAAMLFPLVESCIPEDILRAWLRSPSSKIVEDSTDSETNTYNVKLNQLLSFMRQEVESEERISLAKTGFKFNNTIEPVKYKRKTNLEESIPTASNLFSGENKNKRTLTCIFCEKYHESRDCYTAQKMPISKKKEILGQKRACFLCFRIGHRSKDCRNKIKCMICSKPHNTLMCFELLANKEKIEDKLQEEPIKEDKVNTLLTKQNCSQEVLLQTLIVKIEASNGSSKHARAIFDSGSQRSYILKRTADEMNLNPLGCESIKQNLFGGTTTKNKVHNQYNIKIGDTQSKFHCNIHVLDQPIICGKLPRLKRGPWEKELKEKKIWLTDYGEGCPDIELLIGADFCGQFFTGNMHTLKSNMIVLETKLGWIIMGKVPGKSSQGLSALTVTSLYTQTSSIADLWNLDILGIKDPIETKSRAELERAALDYFERNVSVEENGRYKVRLPWIETNEVLKENLEIAERRCISNSTKLKQEGRYNDYNAVFEEWEKSGVIETVPEAERKNPCYYLPHRGVFKENSTTPVRPVFDASSHGKGYPSLNDCLERGPNLLEKIPPLLMRFRQDKIGVVSDIRKAFLQIAVAKEDCDFLRFLWWENFEKGKMKIYRHKRVVFGLTCSPFLLAAVLNHHIEHNSFDMQETAEMLKRSFYVDNCVTSVPNEAKLQKLIQESRYLLGKACFDLRGWEHTVLNEKDNSEKPIHVLGLLWDKNEDSLFCDLRTVKELKTSITRRSILSMVHKIFDPLGVLCPVTLIPKIIVQQTWSLKINWDAELPEKFKMEFEDWSTDLPLLSNVKLPRSLDIYEPNSELSLHIFCDASRVAYSAAVFLRKVHGEEISVHLIQAKSRVAPLHKMTIPRLELLSCCIGARLASSVIESMDIKDIPTIYWTDSSTALCWIRREEYWGVFVNNRVNEIRTLSKRESWRHVPGEYNPADLPSRGCSVKVLLKSKWWEGPSWLQQEERDWPRTEIQIDEKEVSKEKRKGIVCSMFCNETEEKWYNQRFSRYSQIVRMIAWMLRFCNNTLKPRNRNQGKLSISELETAEKKLLLIIQREVFQEDDFQHKLKTLCTFIDNVGLIRLKTKILRRNDEENFLCPIVLPSNHEVIEKLIRERHLQYSHAGVQTVLTGIRQQFWILRGRRTVQNVIAKCIQCRRHTAKGVETIPTPLPEDRIRDALVFEIVGVDLAGPLYLKDKKKAWILLFTCAVYRAIHLELIQSLSTNCFILGLRRFIARRGRPKIIYSDNGSNFVGMENLMKSLNWEQIGRDTSIFRIHWKFNPPTAAWWGGWWERMVQMVKQLLRRVLGKASLLYEEMLTILCDVEAVINARPLTYVSEDPKDLVPLSPSMFIQDVEAVGVPDLDEIDRVNLSKRLRYQQRLRDDFRRRFRDEYLCLLIQQPKKKKHLIREIKKDDIVLVHCDNKKRVDWPLGRIVDTFPGKDGCVRVVKVKTANGELNRPVQKIYPLEVSHQDQLCSKRKAAEIATAPNVKTRCGRTIVKPRRYDD